MTRSIMQKGWVPIFKVKVSVWAQMLNKKPYKNNSFFPTSSEVWNLLQPNVYGSASSRARVLCDNFGLLSFRSRTRSQWGFNSRNICPDDILRTTEPFLIKCCIIMAWSIKSLGCYLQGQDHNVAKSSKINLKFLTFWKHTVHGIVVHHHETECSVTIWIAVLKVKVTGMVQILRGYLSWRYLLNHRTFCDKTWYVGLSWPGVSYKKFGFLSSRSRS